MTNRLLAFLSPCCASASDATADVEPAVADNEQSLRAAAAAPAQAAADASPQAPLAFHEQVASGLQALQPLPSDGVCLGRLFEEGRALALVDLKGSRVVPGTVARLQAWRAEVQQALQQWERLQVVPANPVDEVLDRLMAVGSTLSQDHEVHAMQQLASLHECIDRGRSQFAAGVWQEAAFADQLAAMHLTALEHLLAGTGDGPAGAPLRRGLAGRGQPRVTSGGSDSLISESEFTAAQKHFDSQDGQAFQQRARELFSMMPPLHAQTWLLRRAAATLRLLKAHGPEQAVKPDLAQRQAMDSLQAQAVPANLAYGQLQQARQRLEQLRLELGRQPPALEHVLAYREVAARAARDRGEAALAVGDVETAFREISASQTMSEAALSALVQAQQQQWDPQDLQWQCEQRVALLEQAQDVARRCAGGELAGVQVGRLLRLEALAHRFDHAPAYQEASRVLYDMDELLQRMLQQQSVGEGGVPVYAPHAGA